MSDTRRAAVAGFLARYPRVCEVAVGTRADVARRLAAAGVEVTVTDISEPPTVPDDVRFVKDDLFAAQTREDPGSAYQADAVYGLNLPPELQRPAHLVARRVDADFLFTTLGGDPAAVPAHPRVIDGTTVFRAQQRGPRHAGRNQPNQAFDRRRPPGE